MPVELTDEQYQQAVNVDRFLRTALSHPEARRHFLREQKRQHPDISIPEIDEADPVKSELAEFKAEVAKEKAERAAKEELDAQWAKFNKGVEAARKRGYTEEGLQKLHKLMEEHGIAEHEAAMPYYEQLNPPPTPVTGSGSRWDFFGPQQDNGLDLKLLHEGKDDEWLDKTIADTLNRVRSGEISR